MKTEHLQIVDDHRLEIAGILRGDDERLLAVIGPCSDQLDEIVIEEGQHLMTRSNEHVKFVHRAPPWKPRTRDEDWHGLDESDQEHVHVRISEMTLRGTALAIETGFQRHQAFLDRVSMMWIGARSIGSTLLKQLAVLNPNIPTGIKNDLSGDIQPALDVLRSVTINREAISPSMSAPVTLIFRGGSEIRTPDQWEAAVHRVVDATKGKVIIDVAHGSEMAHDPSGNFTKSAIAQELCLLHLADLVRQGLDIRGLMIEASDVVIKDKRRQTDPNMDFQDAVDLTEEIVALRHVQSTLEAQAD
jgi:phospho-2-dehydro-3-deoxyheptonate aldolase